jgi:hypothetical protein
MRTIAFKIDGNVIQLDQEQAIAIRKLDATSHLPPQHGQLMPQHSVLLASSRAFDLIGEANNVCNLRAVQPEQADRLGCKSTSRECSAVITEIGQLPPAAEFV